MRTFTDSLSYADAKIACQQQQATLLMLRSREELYQFHELNRRQSSYGTSYLGIDFNTETSTWEWANGEPATNIDQLASNPGRGHGCFIYQPMSYGSQPAQIEKFWSCSRPLMYICQRASK